MKKIIVIGDVHGMYDELILLLEKLPTDSIIVFVGDLIDRGKDSHKVIKLIREKGYLCVRGNHEQAMIDYKGNIYKENVTSYNNGSSLNDWGLEGGEETLDSYLRISNPLKGKIYQDDLKWLETLPFFIEFKDVVDSKGRYLIVSHSQLVNYFNKYIKNLKLLKNSTDDYLNIEYEHYVENSHRLMLFNRDIPNYNDNNFFNIFGHTTNFDFLYEVEDGVITKCHHHLEKMLDTDSKIITDFNIGFADIDTGVCYEPIGEFRGVLTALEFPTMNIYQQKRLK